MARGINVDITVTFDGKDRFEQEMARIAALLDEAEAALPVATDE